VKLTSHDELRYALQLAQAEVRSAADQEVAFERLRVRVPHTVRVLPSDHPLRPRSAEDEYTCFAFALALADAPAAGTHDEDRGDELLAQRNTVSSEFIGWMVRRSLLEPLPEDEKPQNDDVALYGDGAQYCHAGIVHHGRVVSKWGAGTLCEHEVAEVPSMYGAECTFFRPISHRVTRDALLAFVRRPQNSA